MTEYKINVIGALGHSVRSIRIDCTDDRRAIESAKQFIDGHDIELWQGDRRIARFDHEPKNMAGWLKGELKPPK
jgi:hypothetical protein